MSEQQEPNPKIIVDDDWKERVQAEREALKKQEEAGGDAESEPQKEAADSGDSSPPIPAASFSLLITTLVTQALVGLGQVADPTTGKPSVRLELAKHHIDMLGVLEEKTAGNLSSDEAGMLTAALHDLRMMYIAVAKQGS